jgi:hypothetical protein
MRKIASAVAIIALSGCASQQWTPPPAPAPSKPYSLTASDIKTIEGSVAYRMKDPSSTQFRNVVAVQKADGSVAVCGEVNSKNSFGAYNGFSPFSGYLKNGRLEGTSVAYDQSSANLIAKNCVMIGAYG